MDHLLHLLGICPCRLAHATIWALAPAAIAVRGIARRLWC